MPEVAVRICPQLGNGREGGGGVGNGITIIPGGPGFLFPADNNYYKILCCMNSWRHTDELKNHHNIYY